MPELYQFFLYMGRWQLSSPILAVFMAGTCAFLNKAKIKWPTRAEWAGAVVANIVGGCIFFFVDRLIFR
jgi:hypothetical protein